MGDFARKVSVYADMGLEKNHGNAEITLTRVISKLLIGMGLAQPQTEAAF